MKLSQVELELKLAGSRVFEPWWDFGYLVPNRRDVEKFQLVDFASDEAWSATYGKVSCGGQMQKLELTGNWSVIHCAILGPHRKPEKKDPEMHEANVLGGSLPSLEVGVTRHGRVLPVAIGCN